MIAPRTLALSLALLVVGCGGALPADSCPTTNEGDLRLPVEDLGRTFTRHEVARDVLDVFENADAYAEARGLDPVSRATDGVWTSIRARELMAESEGTPPTRFLVGAIDIECDDVFVIDLVRVGGDSARLRVATRRRPEECSGGGTHPIVVATNAEVDTASLAVFEVDSGCANTLTVSSTRVDLSEWTEPTAPDCDALFGHTEITFSAPPCTSDQVDVSSIAYSDDDRLDETVACSSTTLGTLDTECAVDFDGPALHFFASGSKGREAACAREWLLCSRVQRALLDELLAGP